MDTETDLGATLPQFRMLFHLGYPIRTDRPNFLTRRTASSIINRMLGEALRRAEQSRLESQQREEGRNMSRAWKKLCELEDRQHDAEWDELQRRFCNGNSES